MKRIFSIHGLIGLALILALMGGIVPLLAQDNGSSPISVTGAVEAVNGTSIVVSGVTVDLSTANVNIPNLQVGVVVQISGTFTNGVIIATTIIMINPTPMTATPFPTSESTPIVTPSLTPTPAADDTTIIVIEGPIITINVNVITIYNINVSVATDNPILKVIKIGDLVRVEGKRNRAGGIAATVVTLTTASISLNGQVTAINGNVVVVNGTSVQFDPDDSVLTLIKVGDVLNVDGNYQGNGTTLIFIVINITIVNNNITVNPSLPANCKISKNGHIKCSKKKH